MSYAEKTVGDAKNRDRIFVLSGINRFGDRLKKAMNGMSNSELARKSGMSETTIRKYLRGDIYPGIDSAALVANACGVSLVWLISGIEQKDEVKCDVDLNTIDSFTAAILQRLPEEQAKALTDAILIHGVNGILTALNGMSSFSEFLRLSENEREQALRMLKLAEKGASEGGELDIPGSPESMKKQAS